MAGIILVNSLLSFLFKVCFIKNDWIKKNGKI